MVIRGKVPVALARPRLPQGLQGLLTVQGLCLHIDALPLLAVPFINFLHSGCRIYDGDPVAAAVQLVLFFGLGLHPSLVRDLPVGYQYVRVRIAVVGVVVYRPHGCIAARCNFRLDVISQD